MATGTGGREFDHVTGNYTQSITDASVPTVGLPLAVTRAYNGLDPRSDGAFGAGWSTRWDTRILPEPHTYTLLVTYPDGRQLRFAAKGDGTYAAPPGTYATLAEVNAGGWRLMDKSSTSYWFDASGRLIKVSDRRDRTQDLVYGADGKLSKVTATGGRSLTFTWTGNHVTTVSTDSVGGTPLTWTYTYSGDLLTTVCAPGAGESCTTYTYTPASRYRSVITNAEPTGYWRLGDAAATTVGAKVPSSAGWNVDTDAILAGTTADVTRTTPGALAGTSNGAMRFAGTANSSYVRLPSGAINGRGGLLAVEAWFKTTGSGTVIGYHNTGRSTFTPVVYVGTDGKLRGQFYTGTAKPITSTMLVNDGNWHHVVLTGAENTQTLFLDGQSAGTLAGEITHLDQGEAEIGYGYASPSWPASVTNAGPFPFAGEIDEVAVYGKPLGLAEIRTHYAARLVQPQLTKHTLPSGRIWASNAFDADGGRLLTHTDRNGGTWKLSAIQFTRFSDGQDGLAHATIVTTDPNQGTLTYVVDATRGYRPVSEADQLGKVTRYEYDSGGYPAKVIDRNGNVTELFHDLRGNTIGVKRCRFVDNCQTASSEYYLNKDEVFDPRNDKIIVYRDARSSRSTDDTYATRWEYNQHGEEIKETIPATADFPQGRSTQLSYTDGSEAADGGGWTPAGLVKAEIDAKGKESTYRYTASGDLAEEADRGGLRIKYGHDAIGRVISRTEISQAHPQGVMTTMTYNGLGRILTHTGAAVKNEITNVTHTPQTKYEYNQDGLAVSETAVDLTGGDPDRVISYTYDDFGRLETQTGPEGGLVRYAWDHTGAQTAVTDELGNLYHYTYSPRGELASRTLKNWTGSPVAPQAPRDLVLDAYSYDPEGRLAAEVDSMGRKTSYTYFDDGLTAQVLADDVKLNGATTTKDVVLESNTYDAAGNVTKRVTGDGKETITRAYDAAARVTTETFDPTGLARKAVYVYDANDNLLKKTFSAVETTRAESVEYAYNIDDMLIRRSVNNGDSDIVTTWAVDDRGLLVGETDPRGNAANADPIAYRTTFRYDAVGRLIEAQAPSVTVEKNGAEAAAERPSTRFGYDSAGRRTNVVDAEGGATTVVFDRLGRKVSQKSPVYTQPGGTALTPTVGYTYDKAGRLTKLVDERGSTWVTEYDALGNRVRVTEPAPAGQSAGQWVYEYDTQGELLTSVDPTGARTQATYDDLGRQITSTIIERKPTPTALVTAVEYDGADNKVKEIAPGNRSTTFDVNAAGEVTAVTDSLGDVTRYAYDLAGRETKTADPLGNATQTEYDLAGRRTVVRELDSAGEIQRSVAYGYDLAGNSTTETSGEGRITRRTFDATDMITKVVEPVSDTQNITTTFGYNAAGELTRATDGRDQTVRTTYNSLGLVESVIEPETQAHPALADRTWINVYDAGGNLTSVRKPGGVQMDRQFDHLGRLTKETGSGASVTTSERTFGYDLAGRQTGIGDYSLEYNDRGLLTKVTKSTKQIAAFNYDDMGNPLQRTDTNGTANFTWDADDRLKTAAEPVTGRTFTYDYDTADRLKSLTSANPANTQSFGYDAMDRVISHTLLNSSGAQLAKIQYGWNKDDQLVSKETTGTAGAGANTYGYDQAGRLTSWKGPDGNLVTYEWDAAGNRTKAGADTFVYDERNRLLSGAGTDYAYTPRGTLQSETSSGVTKSLTFDAFDRMISDGDASYGYDALGRLTSRTRQNVTENYLYSGIDNDISSVTDSNGAVIAKYGRDPDGNLLGLQEGSDPALGVMSDQHSDMVATFSGSALVDSAAYDPFGKVLARTGTQRRMGYQGEYTDPATGKVNMLARWYMPGTGGFASRDDVTLSPYSSINLNRYTYANGDPLSLSDPSGNCPICIPLLFAAARVAAQIIARRIAQQMAAAAARAAAARLAAAAVARAAQRAAQAAAQRAAQAAAQRAAAAARGKATTPARSAKQPPKPGNGRPTSSK
ncbi:RHS repeat-associated core domain-containing protein, partial [Nonomuraea sp. NPDC049152]|uniref:RHS repeat-associated core domain-containing protein n=1 Tax=Nonomuraea sp. NPDC049152 TaxID=3154350 RepID=UPI0033ECC5CE